MNLLPLFRSAMARFSLRGMASNLTTALAVALLASPGYAGDPVLAGSSVTFYATADGSPAPTFQWRKNGTPIVGATGQTYAIPSATLADAGSYSVVATNNLGSATSPDEVLTVQEVANVAPVITTQPVASQSVVAGGSATFSVVATGSPTPTYQWLRNGTAIAGATSSSLTLIAVSSGNAGDYSVVVSNIAGSVTSSTAVLTVTDAPATGGGTAPVILGQSLTSQSVPVNGTVTFWVEASGSPSPAFQWRKNGTAISGATSPSLTLSPVATGDAGTYHVVVSNTAGSVTSSDAVLTVTESGTSTGGGSGTGSGPGGGSGIGSGTGGVGTGGSTDTAPSIQVQPVASQTVAAGASASISVTASGSPAPTYQWRRNGSDILGATSSTYTIASVASTDAATYSVVITNSVAAVVSANSVLEVEGSASGSKPVILAQPTSQYVADGASARFTVSVSAVPGATYQWRKNGTNVPGATSSSLSFPSVSSADVGTYTVLATNPAGSVTSSGADLVIAGPPVITKQPLSRAVYAKSNVTLSVSAIGSPAPTYQWRKNGTAISGANSSSLVLKGVTKADAGKYTVQVSNSIGWVLSTAATLMVENRVGKRDEDVIGSDSGSSSDTAGSAGTSQLVNLSVRANAGTGSEGLIVGFVVDGATSNKQVLIRGVGPTLRDFGVTGALADPSLALYSGANLTAANDDWITNENALAIEGVSAGVGAFGLRERGADAALMATLKSGAYTAQVSSKDASTGVALVEVYDTAAGSGTRLVNLSVRSQVGGAAEAPNVGFVIAGTTPKRVLIRAVGPALQAFGVSDAIGDPQLEVYRGPTLVEQNDNWGGGEVYNAIFTRVGAFGFSDPESRDAVLFTVLEPGAYTVVVSGVNGSSGVGLVELYEVP